MTPCDLILSRLENPRPDGTGWRARCPAHDGKNTGTLRVSEADNGSALLHCFFGCSVLEVVHALGLELSDLFDRPTETVNTPRPTWQQRELMKMRQWKKCRSDFVAEANVLLSIAGQACHGYEVTTEDKVRAERAARIVRETLEAL